MLNITEKTLSSLDELPDYLETIIKEYKNIQVYISNTIFDKINNFGFSDNSKYQIVKAEVTATENILKAQKYYVLANSSFNHSSEHIFSVTENNKEYNQLLKFKHSDVEYSQLDNNMEHLVLINIE